MQEINNKNRKVKKRFKDSYLKKKYLGQVKYLRGLIESDKRLLEENEYSLINIKGMDYSKEKIKEEKRSTLESRLDKSDELKKRILKSIETLLEKQNKIKEYIDNMPNLEYRLLLQLRYLECKSWAEVEHILDIEYTTRNQKHSLAINQIFIPDIDKYNKI